ncbi:RNA polymerase sigma-70 factor [Virgibacillus soli]|uniref:RNA polymerase sigma-70 factor n=2 Tax=Lederbergia galactosidilytica TaxID=217031 RepID=A0A178A2J2_9BACI|nr:RNA polymerase sigma factor [Lederbergia galactosidilytica]KRG15688.1 RNA polymerase sigma-70 factor [Virgibacillus soli]OAK74039.1 RNA polymerase sigma-70 factor [Lederbergia galactosidilytica]
MKQEQRWIKRIKRSGHHESANQLISKYYQEIYGFVYKQTLDADLSLDLTQEIFISVLQSIHRFDGQRASFRTWLYRVATNRIVDYYRSKNYKYRQLAESLDDQDVKDQNDFILSLEYKEDVERITMLVNQLETVSQEIIRLKLFGEYTLQEIAKIVQAPLSTVKTKYYKALKEIKKEMEEDCDV